MKAVIFGAGNIGRGLVGVVLAEAGYTLTFVDANRDLVDRLAGAGAYDVVTDTGRQTVSVHSVVDAADTGAVMNAVREADLVATAVGAAVLGVIAPAIGAGLADRTRPDVNVLACENVHPNSAALAEHVRAVVGESAVRGVGFPDVVVDRIVPGDAGDLTVRAEASFEFVVDRPEWVGPVPASTDLIFTDDIEAYRKRKLWIVNGLHVMAAWLGLAAGHEYVHETVTDPAIRPSLDSAASAIVHALAGETDEFSEAELQTYARGVMERFERSTMPDPVERVARNPLLKFGPDERVLAPARAAEAAGAPLSGLAAGIAAGLTLQNSRVVGAELFADELTTQGWQQFLTDRGVAPHGRLMNAVAARMEELEERGSQMVMEEVLIRNPAGLHARPAAQIVEQAKALDANIEIRKGGKVAKANSIMSVLALGANSGDTVVVVAEGQAAEEALLAMRSIMEAQEGS